MVVKQAVALRQADSRPPRWQVFWMTLMECGWKDRLTLIWTTLLELQKEGTESKELLAGFQIYTDRKSMGIFLIDDVLCVTHRGLLPFNDTEL